MRAAYYGSGPLTGAGQSVGLFEYAGYEISDVQRYFQTLNQPSERARCRSVVEWETPGLSALEV
jgi:hypothetical protein